MMALTFANVANMIPDEPSRVAWIKAGMPLDLAIVAEIVLASRKKAAKVKSRIKPTSGVTLCVMH